MVILDIDALPGYQLEIGLILMEIVLGFDMVSKINGESQLVVSHVPLIYQLHQYTHT